VDAVPIVPTWSNRCRTAYPRWLRQVGPGERMLLTWEVSEAHRNEKAEEKPENRTIGSCHILPEMTGKLQLSYSHIFGSFE
jgi:hypothetical protein